jgi:hypothetical protein
VSVKRLQDGKPASRFFEIASAVVLRENFWSKIHGALRKVFDNGSLWSRQSMGSGVINCFAFT